MIIINTLILDGNLTKNAELKQVGDKTVIKFSIANNEGYGDKKKTTFVNCTLWGSEKLGEMLVKGTKVLLKGKLNIREHEGKFYTEMLVDGFGGLQLLSSKQENKASDVFENTHFDDEMIPVDEGSMPF